MNKGCEKEHDLIRQLREGLHDEAMKEHVAACPECAETELVASFLQEQASTLAARRPLPSPDLIWLRAQLSARQEAAQRATRSITVVERISWILGAAAGVLLLLWGGQSLLAPFESLWSSLASSTAAGVAQPWLVITLSAGVIVVLALFDKSTVNG